MFEIVSYICVVVAGLLAGSFLSLCAYRIPLRIQVVTGRSHCDKCRAEIAWPDKLPVVGFLLLRGRGRCCDHPLPRKYLLSEIAGGVVFAFLFWQSQTVGDFVVSVFLVSLLALGAAVDLSDRLLPDRVTFTGAALAFVLAGVLPQKELMGAMAGFLVCGGFLYIGGLIGARSLRQPGAMGGGDIKFGAMIGAFLGWQAGLLAVVIAACVGAAFGILRILIVGDTPAARQIPFGPFLAIGATVSLFWGPELLHFYLTTFGVS